jgi:hypothetical protein
MYANLSIEMAQLCVYVYVCMSNVDASVCLSRPPARQVERCLGSIYLAGGGAPHLRVYRSQVMSVPLSRLCGVDLITCSHSLQCHMLSVTCPYSSLPCLYVACSCGIAARRRRCAVKQNGAVPWSLAAPRLCARVCLYVNGICVYICGDMTYVRVVLRVCVCVRANACA